MCLRTLTVTGHVLRDKNVPAYIDCVAGHVLRDKNVHAYVDCVAGHVLRYKNAPAYFDGCSMSCCSCDCVDFQIIFGKYH